MNRLFEIQTLSAKVPARYNPKKHYLVHGYEMKTRKRSLSDHVRLSDPVAILTGGVGLISQFFPNIFPNRTRLTKGDLDQLFPGNGYWTVQLKNYLLQYTQWKEDMKYWYPFVGGDGVQQSGYIKDFVYINRNNICPACPTYNDAWSRFQQILKEEASLIGGGGTGTFPGYQSEFNPMNLLLIGGAVVVGAVLLKKNKRKK